MNEINFSGDKKRNPQNYDVQIRMTALPNRESNFHCNFSAANKFENHTVTQQLDFSCANTYNQNPTTYLSIYNSNLRYFSAAMTAQDRMDFHSCVPSIQIDNSHFNLEYPYQQQCISLGCSCLPL